MNSLTTRIKKDNNKVDNVLNLYIHAYSKGNKVGELRFEIDKYGTAMSDMVSKKPGTGIPFTLITRAKKELQQLANERESEIVHVAVLSTKLAKERLPKWYEQLDYERGMIFDGNPTYKKVYNPKQEPF